MSVDDFGPDPAKLFGAAPPAALDVVRARRETPGCESLLHFNNAGAALMPEPVLEAVIRHLELEAEIGGYEAAERAEASLDRIYLSVAHLLNCDRSEIAIVENATRAWDMAFYSLELRPGDRILTGKTEYASNYLAFLQASRRTGATIDVIPSAADGTVSLDGLRNLIDDRVRLIAITHVPTNGGLINPAEDIGAIALEAGIPYLLDACQSVGQMPIDVERIGCSMLAATGRKYLRGPRGTGFLYVNRQVLPQLEPPFIDMHAATWTEPDRFVFRPDARRFENWESYVAGRAGLCAAIDYALGWGLESICARVRHLADTLRARLGDVPGVRVHDLGTERGGIVSFVKSGHEPDTLHMALRDQRMNVSVSPASSTLLDMRERGLQSLIRASVHYYNTKAEIDRFCAEVDAL
jgi:cysteine desulfurase/selenocysteine lyase